MSGSVLSTGILTNKGANLLEIERISNLRIQDITIQIIPLWSNNAVKKNESIWKISSIFSSSNDNSNVLPCGNSIKYVR